MLLFIGEVLKTSQKIEKNVSTNLEEHKNATKKNSTKQHQKIASQNHTKKLFQIDFVLCVVTKTHSNI